MITFFLYGVLFFLVSNCLFSPCIIWLCPQFFPPKTRFDQMFYWVPLFTLQSPPFLGLFQSSSILDRLFSKSATQLSSWNFPELDFQLDFILTPVTDWFQTFFFCSLDTNYECYQGDLKDQNAFSRAELWNLVWSSAQVKCKWESAVFGLDTIQFFLED